MVGAMVVTLDSDHSKDLLVKKQDPMDQAAKVNKNVIFFSLQKIGKNTDQLQSDIYKKLWAYQATKKK